MFLSLSLWPADDLFFCENKIRLCKPCLIFLYFSASGGWQEPENPHTRVSKGSSEDDMRKDEEKDHFISEYDLGL